MFFVVIIYFSAVTPDPNNKKFYFGFAAIFLVYLAGLYYIRSRFYKERICPKCGRPYGKRTKKTVVKEPTWEERGDGLFSFRCTKCGHEWEESYYILSGSEEAARSRSFNNDDDSSSSSSGSLFGGFGGSWGGGSSSGGGSGRSF